MSIAVGQRWRYGAREYVVETVTAGAGGFADVVSLRNPDTDKFAYVTSNWLLQGPDAKPGAWEKAA